MRPKNQWRLIVGVPTAIFVVWIATILMNEPGVVVTVTNTGGQTMKDVKAILGGRQIDLGDIPSGKSARGRIVPTADSSVVISFEGGGGAVQMIQVDTYVTGGLKGHVDLEIKEGLLKDWKTDLF